MPIDPTGTSPTPTPSEQENPKINLKCRREGCDSITAEEIQVQGNNASTGRHMYRCIKCSMTFHTNLGGTFNF